MAAEPAPPAPAYQPIEPEPAPPQVVTVNQPLLLEKEGPSEVSVGQSFTYRMHVTNQTDRTLDEVEVVDRLSPDFRMTGSTPAASGTEGDMVHWMVGSLEADQTKTISVTGVATSRGMVTHCATASYKMPVCLSVAVVEPSLGLTVASPAQSVFCDPIPVEYTFTNTGTGTANDVRVTSELPAGLVTLDGSRTVALDAGDLEEGESREFEVSLEAVRTGQYNIPATAMGEGDLQADSQTSVAVRRPALAITKTGPEQRYVGQRVSYQIAVRNTGDWVARDTVVEDTVPDGLELVSATDEGTMADGRVRWELGALQPGAERQVGVTFNAEEITTATARAMAEAYCAEAVTASVETVVAGIPALLLEVIDVEDPIALGDEEQYRITVTNQGSAAATNVQIVCTLEDTMEYVSSAGATDGRLRGQEVTFSPLARLAPGDEAEWHVTVRAVRAGDVRFTVRMTGETLTRPVQETESTTFYD